MVVVDTAWEQMIPTIREVQWLLQQVLPTYLKSLLLSLGSWAPVLFLLAYSIRPLLLLPSGVFAITAGMVFGAFWGTVYTVVGATAGSCLAFILARRLGRDWVYRRLGERMTVIDRFAADNGFKVILFLRIVPILPFDVVNYGAGLTNISLWSYAAATVIGVSPLTVAFVYFGQSMARLSLAELIGAGAILTITAAVPMLIRQVWRRA